MSGCDGGGFPALTAAEPASRAAGRGMGSEEESGGVVCSDAEVQSGYMMGGGELLKVSQRRVGGSPAADYRTSSEFLKLLTPSVVTLKPPSV